MASRKFTYQPTNLFPSAKANTKTKVLNIRKKNLNQMGVRNLQEWLQNPNNIYIGGDMTHYVPGAVGSKWGNPFTVNKCPDKDERLRKYKEYVLTDTKKRENGKTLYESLGELKDKSLGCWCHPEPCHGHVLTQLIEEQEKTAS